MKSSFTVDCKVLECRKGKRKLKIRAGGLCLLWGDDIKVSLLTSLDSHIDVVITEQNNHPWRFTGIYGQPKVEKRYLTWALIKNLKDKCGYPWVLGGDFNEIVSLQEKEGGLMRRSRQMESFQQTITDCSLRSMHASGPCFTWRRVRHGVEVKEKLDRF
ncbi:hypothetical protein ACLB2K_031243 [Fragaria x ananassa]